MNKKEITKARKEFIIERRRIKTRIQEIDKEKSELLKRDSGLAAILLKLENAHTGENSNLDHLRKSYAEILRIKRRYKI
jgi:hypothetical protein